MVLNHMTLGLSLLPRARPTERQQNWLAQSQEWQKEWHGKEKGTKINFVFIMFHFSHNLIFNMYVLALDQMCGCFLSFEINNNSITKKQLFAFLEV